MSATRTTVLTSQSVNRSNTVASLPSTVQTVTKLSPVKKVLQDDITPSNIAQKPGIAMSTSVASQTKLTRVQGRQQVSIGLALGQSFSNFRV